jgi:hypothetical protein
MTIEDRIIEYAWSNQYLRLLSLEKRYNLVTLGEPFLLAVIKLCSDCKSYDSEAFFLKHLICCRREAKCGHPYYLGSAKCRYLLTYLVTPPSLAVIY